MTGRPVATIDCFGMLDDTAIGRYFALGYEVNGLGRGHVKQIKNLSVDNVFHVLNI
jgi:UDP-N-acetyl-D-glucosamine dehydrogenase